MTRKDIREYDERRRDAAETLFLLDEDNLPGEMEGIMAKAQRSAHLYAWHELLRYSAQHPRRRCELRVGMGDTALVVERTNGDAWYLAANVPDGRVQPPAFLDRLWAFGQAMGAIHGDWFACGIWVAHHGVMIEGEPI